MIKLHHSLLEGLSHPQPSLSTVRSALQRAIELEHSTIPLYLYAMYSLDHEKNREVVEVIKSVVVEEMLHMVLAANILNALGGHPAISKPDFIPTYPGHLPGGIGEQLEVHLRPFSMAQLDAFIEIEEPREAIDFVTHSIEEIDSCTIGQFYTAIESAIDRLPADAFAPSPHNQVGPDLMFGSITVTDADTANQAINTIIEQGEGTSTSPVEIDGPNGSNDFAHYYRLREIRMGRRLVRVSAQGARQMEYAYEGESIPFDADAVYDLAEDPTCADYPTGSIERRLIDTFNFTYTTLLDSLHRLVNGHADMATFMSSLGLMKSLERQAKAMASGLAAGVPVGPSFEYQPVKPDTE